MWLEHAQELGKIGANNRFLQTYKSWTGLLRQTRVRLVEYEADEKLKLKVKLEQTMGYLDEQDEDETNELMREMKVARSAA